MQKKELRCVSFNTFDEKFAFAVKKLYFYRKLCSENHYVYIRERELVQLCLGQRENFANIIRSTTFTG